MGNFVPTGRPGENSRDLISSFDGAEFVFQESLLEGKFMKSIRCTYRGHVVVVKVYEKITGFDKEMLHNVKSQLDIMRSSIQPRLHPNLMPYHRWAENERAAILVRQYMHSNLFDRQSTRPFLKNIEKRWIAYQILKSVSQAHRLNIVHGDITSENFLITSSNWIFLADFAPFQPTLLPLDDTAPFNYFFVSNAKRDCCCVAPERFCSPTSTMDVSLAECMESSSLLSVMMDGESPTMDAEHELGTTSENVLQLGVPEVSAPKKKRSYSFGTNGNSAKMRPSMDMFSVGCVIMEIFLDGEPCFSLADLLKFAKWTSEERKAFLETKFAKIQCSSLSALLGSLLSFEPVNRLSASRCLEEFVGGIDAFFPSYMEEFLHPFMADMLSSDFDLPDERIWAVCKSYDKIVSSVCRVEDEQGVSYFQSRYTEWINRSLDTYAEDDDGESVSNVLPSPSSREYLNRDSMSHFSAIQELLHRTQTVLDHVKSFDQGDQIKTMIQKAQTSLDKQTGTFKPKTLSVTKIFGKHEENEDIPPGPDTDQGASLIIHLICCTIRFVRFPTTKCIALLLLERLARYTDNEGRLQRVIPFVVTLLSDTAATVRCIALRVLSNVVSLVTQLPQADTRIFPDYIFPILAKFKADVSVTVRLTFAECLPRIAHASARFLELSRLGSPQKRKSNYDADVEELHGIVQEFVSNMVEQPAVVRRTLLCDITRLCIFFGRERTSGHILPILITFLNERNDWQLRATFFEHIPGVGALVGPMALQQFLLPCIIQALQDVEELVIERTLCCLFCLVQLGLLEMGLMTELTNKVILLAFHPNSWIRISVIRLLASLLSAERVSYVEIQVSIVKLLTPILRPDAQTVLLGYTKDVLHNESLLEEMILAPLPRAVFNEAISQKEDTQRSPSSWLKLSRSGDATASPVSSPNISEEDAKKLQAMMPYIRAAMVARRGDRSKPSESASELPPDYLKELLKTAQRYCIVVPDQSHTSLAIPIKFAEYLNLMASTMPPGGFLLQQRPRFKELVDTYGVLARPRKLGDRYASLTSEALSAGETRLLQRLRALEVPKLPPYMGALRSLDGSYYVAAIRRGVSSKSSVLSNTLEAASTPTTKAWRPRGVLCASLYGHESAVNRIAVSQDSLFFATGSDDGTVRLWIATGLEDGYGLRSKLTYASQGGAISDLCMVENTHSIASGSSNGTVHVFNIEHALDASLDTGHNSNLGASTVVEVDMSIEGPVKAVQHFPTVSQSVVAFACESGFIHGWDLRSKCEAWCYEMAPVAGYLTCMAVPPGSDALWFVTGTSRGLVVVWDLRFGIIVSAWLHPKRERINRLYISRATCSDPLVYLGANDLSLYNVADGKLVQGYRNVSTSTNFDDARDADNLVSVEISQLSPITASSVSCSLWSQLGLDSAMSRKKAESSVRAILCPFDALEPNYIPTHKAHVPQSVVSAGTDRHIRYWDSEVSNCYSIWDHEYGAVTKQFWDKTTNKDDAVVTMCREEQPAVSSNFSVLAEGRGLPHPTSNHEDCILDLAYVNSHSSFPKKAHGFLLSASRDGVVKVWV